MSDYERNLLRLQIDDLKRRIVELEAQVAELTARLLDQEGD